MTRVTARPGDVGDAPRMYRQGSLEAFARERMGVFTLADAKAHGWSDQRIRRQVRKGCVRSVLPGVLMFAGAPSSRLARACAALAWAGEGAALCKLTSGEYHRFDAQRISPIQIMTPRRLRAPHSQIRVYRRDDLPAEHLVTRGPLVLTSVPRTLFDLAWDLGRISFETAIDSALSLKKTTLQELWEMWFQLHASGRNGCVRFRASLERRTPGRPPPANRNERRFLELILSAGLPEPICQYPIYDGDAFIARPDFAYPARRLAIQAQSVEWHEGHCRRIQDDLKASKLAACGWKVLTFWWEQLDSEPETVVSVLRRAFS